MLLRNYMDDLVEAWQTKDSEVFANLVSLRHYHAKSTNLHNFDLENECQRYFVSPLDEIVAIHLRVITEMRKEEYNQAYSYQLLLVQTIVKVFQSQKEDNWMLSIVNLVALELRLLATKVDMVTNTHGGQIKSREALEKAADSLMACFRICTTDNRSSEFDTKKWGMMALVNQLFKVYFRINKLNLMKPLIRAIDSSPLKERFSLSHQITYRYFVGRKAMFDSDFALANEYLTFAFQHCHKMSKKNKRLILIYLVPVKMLLGYMPSLALMQKYNILELWEVAEAVLKGRVNELSQVMLKHQAFFIRCGIYLILERLKIITYRNLFKRVYLLENNHVIPMDYLLTALRMVEDPQIDLEEAHCILANLINDGKVKGYISFQHQKLVLSKIDPFPKLSSL